MKTQSTSLVITEMKTNTIIRSNYIPLEWRKYEVWQRYVETTVIIHYSGNVNSIVMLETNGSFLKCST